MKRSRSGSRATSSPLLQTSRADDICLEVEDHSTARYSAIDFFQLRRLGDPQTLAARAARLTEQFVSQNRSRLALLEVRIDREFSGDDLNLLVEASSAVGSVPLMSPTTARLGYGIVVHPRFRWVSLGPMLAEMGWRISPKPLPLPPLPRSERRVPIWVLSFMIFVRMKALIESLERRFELTRENRQAPRGAVRWAEYASRSLSHGKFLSVPCTFPDLRDDRLLTGAIRYTLERHLRALETQKEHGAFVHRLITFGEDLLRRVQTVPAYIPSSGLLANWLRRPAPRVRLTEGLQAIEWTIEERGLAGLSDLEGIPWTMRMDEFFEAWIETVFQVVARRTGGRMRVGRKRETVHALTWEPAYVGSQKALVPDIWLEWDSATLIVDAKYKRHWEELQQRSWGEVEKELRERHRNDLLQVLAYTTLARTQQVIACLAYPCTPEHWHSLRERGRLIHRAQVTVGTRAVHLWLTAVPMSTDLERIASSLTDEVNKGVWGTAV